MYLNIFCNHTIYRRRLIEKNFIFMQDNNSKHILKICKNYDTLTIIQSQVD